MRLHTEHLARAGAAAALVLAGLLACVPVVQQDGPLQASAGGHGGDWMDRASASFHGTIVKEANFDFTKAKWKGMACSVCHAGSAPGQPSPVAKAPNCFACHAGGPDGSAGHPPRFMDISSPDFHGLIVKAAGYDYTRAFAGSLTCNTCHAGESPTQVSPKSDAPNCYFCHLGGPDGSAAHPVGWGDTAGPVFTDYAGPASCVSCHGTLPSPRPGQRHPVAVALDAEQYTGISVPVTITVTDPDANRDPGAVERVSVTIKSLAEPAGEAVSLVETTASSGTFLGTIALERVFGEDGAARPIGANGKLAIYAEGDVATDSITATYGTLGKTAGYTEPPSTVTGIVRVGGIPVGGAGVQLSGGGGLARSTVSRSDGSYAFHEIPSGTFTIVAAKSGAKQLTSTVVVP